MIVNRTEYEKAREELRALEERLGDARSVNPSGHKGFTQAGVRKMIARLYEELVVYECSGEAITGSGQPAKANDNSLAPPPTPATNPLVKWFLQLVLAGMIAVLCLMAYALVIFVALMYFARKYEVPHHSW